MMMTVHLVLKTFLLDLRDHQVLLWLDNMMVVAYINHQGGPRLHPLNRLEKLLLLWAQHILRLHPQTVQII